MLPQRLQPLLVVVKISKRVEEEGVEEEGVEEEGVEEDVVGKEGVEEEEVEEEEVEGVEVTKQNQAYLMLKMPLQL